MCPRHDDHGFPKFWISGKYHQLIQESEQLQGLVKTGTENEFPPVCGCTLLFYCFLYRRSQNDCTTEVPNEVSQVVWRPVRASENDVILELWKSGYLMVYPTGAPSRQECNSKEEKVGFRKM